MECPERGTMARRGSEVSVCSSVESESASSVSVSGAGSRRGRRESSIPLSSAMKTMTDDDTCSLADGAAALELQVVAAAVPDPEHPQDGEEDRARGGPGRCHARRRGRGRGPAQAALHVPRRRAQGLKNHPFPFTDTHTRECFIITPSTLYQGLLDTLLPRRLVHRYGCSRHASCNISGRSRRRRRYRLRPSLTPLFGLNHHHHHRPLPPAISPHRHLSPSSLIPVPAADNTLIVPSSLRSLRPVSQRPHPSNPRRNRPRRRHAYTFNRICIPHTHVAHNVF